MHSITTEKLTDYRQGLRSSLAQRALVKILRSTSLGSCIVDAIIPRQVDDLHPSRWDSVSVVLYGCWCSSRFHTCAFPFWLLIIPPIIPLLVHHLLPIWNEGLFGALPTMSVQILLRFIPFQFTQTSPLFFPVKF